jgi:hypothetical protein
MVQGRCSYDGRPAVAGRDVVGRTVQEQQVHIVKRRWRWSSPTWIGPRGIGERLDAPAMEHGGSCRPGLMASRS